VLQCVAVYIQVVCSLLHCVDNTVLGFPTCAGMKMQPVNNISSAVFNFVAVRCNTLQHIASAAMQAQKHTTQPTLRNALVLQCAATHYIALCLQCCAVLCNILQR